MVNNKEVNELIDEIMLEKISKMSTREIREDLANYSHDVDAMKRRFMSKLKTPNQFRKKQTLKVARQEMERQRREQSNVDVQRYLTEIKKDAKGILIELLAQGKLPENLTLAFRDGKEFTDDDAEKILEDLINMGAIEFDHKKD